MMKKQIGGGITYKNLKGFTLIELLAVIVILAVIALILTPIVSGIIKTAKKNAFESTGYGILESTKLYYSKKVGDLETDLTFTCNNDTCTSEDEKLEFKGNINGSGTVLLFKDGNIALCLESEDYATIKNINDERLSTTEQGTCEFDDETKEYAVIGTVSARDYEILQNEYDNLNNTYTSLMETYTSGKKLIAEAITSKGIETSEEISLDEMATNISNIIQKTDRNFTCTFVVGVHSSTAEAQLYFTVTRNNGVTTITCSKPAQSYITSDNSLWFSGWALQSFSWKD